jgi:hypothetical protein
MFQGDCFSSQTPEKESEKEGKCAIDTEKRGRERERERGGKGEIDKETEGEQASELPARPMQSSMCPDSYK